jgi:hypothetical protein
VYLVDMFNITSMVRGGDREGGRAGDGSECCSRLGCVLCRIWDSNLC